MSHKTKALRPLGIHEEMFWRLDKAMPLNLTFALKLKGKLDETMVKEGLAVIQRQHPLLRVCIQEEKQVPYFVACDRVIPLQVEEGDDERVNELIDFFTNDIIDTQTGPLLRCALVHFSEDTHVLIFGYHHAITDGRSMVLVWRDFLDAMAKRGRGDTNEPPPFALPEPYENGLPRSSKGVLGYIKWNFSVSRLYWGIFRSGLFLKFLPLQKQVPLEQRRMKIFHHLLSKETSSQFIESCKAKGVSVHSALHAAFALSAYEATESKKAQGLFIGTIADLKENLMPAPPSTTGLFASAMGFAHSVKPGVDLWTLAKQLQEKLHQDKKLNISHVLTKYQFLPLNLLGRWLEKASFLKILNGFDSIQPKAIPLSNIGVINHFDNLDGSLAVVAAKASVAVSILGNISAGAFTLNGQIYSFVGACLPLVTEETVQRYHQRAMDIVEESVIVEKALVNADVNKESHGLSEPLPNLVTTRLNFKKYFQAKDLYDYFYQLSKEQGDLILVKGVMDMYVVNHPELVKQILKDTNQDFDKRSPFYLRFRRMFGKGIVTSEDNDWRQQRDILQPLFTTKGSKSFFAAILAAVEANAERWQQQVGKKLDIGNSMNGIALDIVARAFLSKDTLGKDKSKIEDWVRNINRYIGCLPIPLLSEPWFPRPTSWKGWYAKRQFRAYIRSLIHEREGAESRNDLLSLLIESGQDLDDNNLIDQVMTLVFGGHETSATAMVWTWYLLAKNPEAERRLHKELDQVLGGRSPQLEDLSKLRYTKACIEEAMRLYPPFWFENRNTTKPVQLGNTTIPKGKMVVFSRYSLHRHASLWEQPDSFRPERFMDLGAQNQRHRFASVPFGGGPRICVGINFARMEVLMVFAVLAQKYRLRLDDEAEVDLVSDLTLSPKGRLEMRLEQRQSGQAGVESDEAVA